MIRAFKKEENKKIFNFIKEINDDNFIETGRPPRYEDLENISETYGGKRDSFFVYEEGRDIVGTAALKEEDSKVALLRRVFVLQKHRQKGYGLRLINRVFEFAREKGYQKIIFRCTNQMTAALHLIIKKGFEQKEEVDFGKYKVLIMEKKL
jgi:N-acetylglutamate synthase-like GNAT family acetyltransferase